MLFRYIVKRQSLPLLLRGPRYARFNSSVTTRDSPDVGEQASAVQQRNPRPSPNEGILDMLRLEKQEEERRLQPNIFKVNAFANAIEAIQQVRETIKSGDDYALEIKGVGLGIKNRINQYFVNLDLEAACNQEQEQDALMRKAILELQNIPKVGAVKAKALAEAGCWSLEQLVNSDKYHHMLGKRDIIRLRYIKHLEKTMTRAEAERVLEACRAGLPGQYEVVLAGEYRRGLPEISELVVMLLHPDCVHVPMPSDPPPPNATGPSTVSVSDSAEGTEAGSTSSSTTTPTPAKRKHKTLIKKSERSASLTKASRKTSLLHTEVIPCLRKVDVMCETLKETLNTWTGVVRIPEGNDGGYKEGRGLDPFLDPSQDSANQASSSSCTSSLHQQQEAQVTSEAKEEPTGSSVSLSLQTPFGTEYRQVVFHLVPQKSRATALLALTGDDDLNRHMRRKADEMGMLLNEYGLWKWNPRIQDTIANDPTTEEATSTSSPTAGHWGLVKTPTEGNVFEALKMGFVRPEKRSWRFLSASAKMKPSKKKFATAFLGS